MISFTNEKLKTLTQTVADGNADAHDGEPNEVERAEARATLQLNAIRIIASLIADYEYLHALHFGGRP